MTRVIDHIGPADDRCGYVVRRPRMTDAVGAALSLAFTDRAGVPEDMRHILDAIDRRVRN